MCPFQHRRLEIELDIDPGSTPDIDDTTPTTKLNLNALKSARSDPDGEEILESFDEAKATDAATRHVSIFI